MSRSAPIPQAGPLDSTTGAQRDGILFPSAAYTSAGGGVHNSPAYVNHGWRGARFYIKTTAVGAAGTVDFKLQNQDPVSGSWVDIPNAAIAQMNTNTSVTLTIYPGIAETANVDIADPLGVIWRAVLTIGGNDVTLSVGADYIDS